MNHRSRFVTALGSYAVLGLLAYATLDDPRMWQFVLIFLAGMALLTWTSLKRKERGHQDPD